jgi:hypothetical protein
VIPSGWQLKLAAAGAIALAVLAVVFKLIGMGRTAERAESRARAIKTKGRMDDANAAGPHTPDDVDKRLRDGGF